MAQAKGQPYPGSDSGPPFGPMDNRSALDKAKTGIGWVLQQNANGVSRVLGSPMNITNREQWLGQRDDPPKKAGGKVKKRGGKVHGAPSRPRLDRAPRKGGGGC